MARMWRRTEFALVAVTTFIIGFIVTFAGSLIWLGWMNPVNNAQGDMSAFMIAALVAPFFSAFCSILSWRLTRAKYSN